MPHLFVCSTAGASRLWGAPLRSWKWPIHFENFWGNVCICRYWFWPFSAELIDIFRKFECTNEYVRPLGVCVSNASFARVTLAPVRYSLLLRFLFHFGHAVIVCQIFDFATWQSNFRKVFVPSSKTISNPCCCESITDLCSAFFHYPNQTLIETMRSDRCQNNNGSLRNIERIFGDYHLYSTKCACSLPNVATLNAF